MSRDRTSRLRVLGLLTAVLLMFAACAGENDDADTTAGGGEETDGATQSVTLQVTALDNSFDPSSLEAPAGSEVTVELTNEGNNPHTFTIDDPAADTSGIDGGESGTATFTMPDGSVTFYCAIHGKETMFGTLEST